jgi:hypothetical protein
MNEIELVPTRDEMEIYESIAKYATDSKYFDKLGGIGGIMCIALRAREMGISPFEAIYGGFSNVQGKLTMSSELMGSLIRRSGHKLQIIQSSNSVCEIKGTRSDTGESYVAIFTMEEARMAGLVRNGSGWEKYPSDMLYARCISRLRRRLFQDIATKAYVEGEIEDEKPTKFESKIEMETIQAEIIPPKPVEKPSLLTIPQILEIEKLSAGNEAFLTRILTHYKVEKLSDIEEKHFEVIRNGLINLRRAERYGL